jgi:hypothetical protein
MSRQNQNKKIAFGDDFEAIFAVVWESVLYFPVPEPKK